MAALLRSGKILRLVSGFATRQQQQQIPSSNPGGPGGGGGAGGNNGTNASGVATDRFDASATFNAWSLQHLQCALPAAAGGADLTQQNDNEEEISLEDIGHNITREEIRALLRGVGHLEESSPAKHSQSVLVLRLCGAALENDVPDSKDRTKLVNEAWTEMEESLGVRMTVDHYNALLAVYSDNNHAFCPEHVSSRLKKSGLKPNKETLRALLDRYCQEGNMDGANNMLKALFQEHRQPKQELTSELPSIEHKPSSAEASKEPSTPDSDFSSTPSTPPLTNFSREDPQLTIQKDTQNTSEAMPVVASSGQMGAGQIVVIPSATQNEAPTVMRAVPMVQVFNPQTRSYQYQPLPSVCETLRSQGRFWDLENLLSTSTGAYTPDDRRSIFMYTLMSYADQCQYDRAMNLWQQLQAEGLSSDFPQFHALMAQLAASVATTASSMTVSELPSIAASEVPSETAAYALSEAGSSGIASSIAIAKSHESSASARPSCPPTPASSVATTTTTKEATTKLHKIMKRFLAEKDVEAAYNTYKDIQRCGKTLNVTEASTLIELLLNAERLDEAMTITEEMLEKNTYPLPKIFRYLLNKMASSGDVDTMVRMGAHLSPKVKKEVSFDNRLCNAYLSAGQGAQFLRMLEADLDSVLLMGNPSEEDVQGLKDRFPRGGAMGLLEGNTELVDDYARLAGKFVHLGYVAPVNVLWTYYFINAQHDKAQPLWDAYVKDCPQIMFQKVCQTARSKKDADLAGRLVDLLKGARVTSGAQGIALSCLLDVLCVTGRHIEAFSRLNEALQSGVKLEDVNRTALTRIKSGVEAVGIAFPYEVPKKRVSGSTASGRSSAIPASVIDEEEDHQESRCLSPMLE